MQGDCGENHPFRLQGIEYFPRKMKAGGRRGHRTWMPGEDGLVALPVLGMLSFPTFDVWRQRPTPGG